MSTTLTTLAMTIAAEKAIQTANAKLPALKAFSTGFKAAEVKSGSKVNVPLFASRTAAAFNKTTNNYQGTTKGVSGVDILIDDHIVDSIPFDDIDFAECDVPFWTGAGEAAGKSIAKGILAVAFANITAAKYAGKTIMAEADAANMKNWALLRKAADDADLDATECRLLVNSTYFSYLLSLLDVSKYGGTEAVKAGVIPGLFGFAEVVDCPTLPTTANLVGAIAHPTCMGVAGRLLKAQSPKAYEEIGSVTDDASGLTIGFRRFGVAGTGENFLAYEALFGADVVSGSALVRVVKA